MRVKRGFLGALLLGCICLHPLLHPLKAQTLSTPKSGLKPLSYELTTSAPDLQLPKSDSILPADRAFGFKALVESKSVLLSWAIQPGYYLYQSKLTISDNEGRPLTVELPQATLIDDEFMGKSRVYFDSLQIRLPHGRNPPKEPANYSLTVEFQGCAKDRYCYPLQTKVVALPQP